MRPSIGSGVQTTAHGSQAPLVVHVAKPQPDPGHVEAKDRDEAAPSHEPEG
jgi:hypothetical protein